MSMINCKAFQKAIDSNRILSFPIPKPLSDEWLEAGQCFKGFVCL